MKHIALTGREGSKSLVPVLSEHKAWVADSRFTTWEDSAAMEHAFPQPLPPAMTLYERFGEECAARNIIPTYRLFEHWLDSDAIARMAQAV